MISFDDLNESCVGIPKDRKNPNRGMHCVNATTLKGAWGARSEGNPKDPFTNLDLGCKRVRRLPLLAGMNAFNWVNQMAGTRQIPAGEGFIYWDLAIRSLNALARQSQRGLLDMIDYFYDEIEPKLLFPPARKLKRGDVPRILRILRDTHNSGYRILVPANVETARVRRVQRLLSYQVSDNPWIPPSPPSRPHRRTWLRTALDLP